MGLQKAVHRLQPSSPSEHLGRYHLRNCPVTILVTVLMTRPQTNLMEVTQPVATTQMVIIMVKMMCQTSVMAEMAETMEVMIPMTRPQPN